MTRTPYYWSYWTSTTFEEYGSDPYMCKLLAVFWDQQEFVTHQNGYNGLHFKENRGATKGGIIFPTLFNLIVDNLVHNLLALMVEDQLFAQEGLELAVWRCLGLFYSKYGMMVSWDPEWLQGALNVIISLFRRFGLLSNVEKSKATTCQPGALRYWMSEEAVGKMCTIRGATYQELLIWLIPCPDCGVELTAVLMTVHR